ncbi:ribonuclease J [Helicobacter cholecystus]|uniref:Ribonuclease J n=1 Tax=Helicobacter cholecystus TaxID=45498 RepID=A0A3D8IXP8_9HELI|nr:ribonuclease J [Helicobacter cholecystus]RDU70038.1 ribonuclease J [Helicobacter cholecystus]VEJ24795.1 putative metallo-beta-lactamase family protein [Helicobacter cholecystus]
MENNEQKIAVHQNKEQNNKERRVSHTHKNNENKEHKRTQNRRWSGKNNYAHNKNTKEEVQNHDGVREIKSTNEKGNLNLHRELKRNVDNNTRIQKNSLNPHYKLNLNTKSKVRITPLGGLGEIGGNMTVIETEKSAIIIDVGMSFPDESMPGVDILVPDFSYLQTIKDKIEAVIITHAHEDHIGAVPYLYKVMQFPLYGTPLPLGMISAKFDEHGLKKYRSLFRSVEKRKPIKIGEFEIEWIHITHSVIDASALAIRTEAGVILHTGDFKIDHTPVDGLPTDLHRLAYYGEEGVMVLLSDSTNSHKSGVTPSEAVVGPTFDALFKQAEGRVIMSTFSSNIHRVYQAINYAIKYNRKVAVIGRSMEKNLEIARELGYINIPQGIFIEAHEVEKYPDEEVLIVTTGSQGETMSALYRMATDEHRHIKMKPSDLVIISAKAIPGNEGSVSAVINFLQKSGARVVYQDFSEIHVSGHAAQEEQKLMLRLIKPKFFLPVHGEYNHIAKHKETAIKCGVPEKNIYLMEDGDQIEVNPNYIRKVRSVKTGKTFIDNQADRQIDYNTILDRQNLANDGVVTLSAKVSKKNMDFDGEVRISSFGLTNPKDEKALSKEIADALTLMLKAFKKEFNSKNIEIEARNILKKLIFKQYKKYPLLSLNFFVD